MLEKSRNSPAVFFVIYLIFKQSNVLRVNTDFEDKMYETQSSFFFCLAAIIARKFQVLAK